MKVKIVKSSSEAGAYDLVSRATGEVLIAAESFGVVDNVADSINFGCHMHDECGEIAAAILAKNLG